MLFTGDDRTAAVRPTVFMYTNFRHHYLEQHGHHGSTLTVHPGPLFAVAVCLVLLMAWAAFQTQGRCGDCREWPVRCRCSRERARR